jgi:isoamylase
VGSGYPDISWHGVRAWQPDWSDDSRILAFMLCGKHANNGQSQDNQVYVAMNMHWETHLFELPELPQSMQWHVFANTIATPPEDIWNPGSEPLLKDQQQFLVGPRSVVILVGE